MKCSVWCVILHCQTTPLQIYHRRSYGCPYNTYIPDVLFSQEETGRCRPRDGTITIFLSTKQWHCTTLTPANIYFFFCVNCFHWKEMCSYIGYAFSNASTNILKIWICRVFVMHYSCMLSQILAQCVLITSCLTLCETAKLKDTSACPKSLNYLPMLTLKTIFIHTAHATVTHFYTEASE